MNKDPTFEIHVHGEMELAAGTTVKNVADALEPMWRYAKADSFSVGANGYHEHDPGILHTPETGTLQICWTVMGEDDFRQVMETVCQNLNEISAAAACIRVQFFDLSFEYMGLDGGDGDDDEDDEDEDDEDEGGLLECDDTLETRDDYLTLFVGPNPESISKMQRDTLVQDVSLEMQTLFEPSELDGVIAEIDKLFDKRRKAVNEAIFGKWFTKPLSVEERKHSKVPPKPDDGSGKPGKA